MSDATEYGWKILRDGVPGREWITAWMDIDKFHRDAIRHNKFMYGSPYRPLGHAFMKDRPEATVANLKGKGRSLVLTKEPLDHDALYRWELIPVSPDAIGWYILELANAEKNPVELSKDGDKAAMLFKNPRGIWQLSYFDERGPVGHQEGEDPGKLVYEAYVTGYRTWAPGIVDALSVSFEGLRAARGR